jgi:hypothetical protein
MPVSTAIAIPARLIEGESSAQEIEIVVRLALTTDRSEACHAERDDRVDLVMLLHLVETPTSTTLDDDRAVDCQAHRGVGIERETAALYHVEQVLRRCG